MLYGRSCPTRNLTGVVTCAPQAWNLNICYKYNVLVPVRVHTRWDAHRSAAAAPFIVARARAVVRNIQQHTHTIYITFRYAAARGDLYGKLENESGPLVTRCQWGPDGVYAITRILFKSSMCWCTGVCAKQNIVLSPAGGKHARFNRKAVRLSECYWHTQHFFPLKLLARAMVSVSANSAQSFRIICLHMTWCSEIAFG